MAASIAVPNAETAQFTDAVWAEAGWLPCELSVEVSIPGFRMRDLLLLEANSIVDTHSGSNTEVALRVNGALVGRAEFAVAGDRLSVRLTELA
jgi:flagellar motor switch/type III secretory pathway protein FliN